mgnify:CR=1 FL=1
MTHEAILEKLNEIFQDIFDDDSLVITETTTANDVEDWDSIEHINLIDAVEKEFGMKFKMQEVSGMKNVRFRRGKHKKYKGITALLPNHFSIPPYLFFQSSPEKPE